MSPLNSPAYIPSSVAPTQVKEVVGVLTARVSQAAQQESVTTAPEIMKKSCFDFMMSTNSKFTDLAKVWDNLSKMDSEINEKIQAFKKEFGGAVQALKGQDWKVLKKARGDNMQKEKCLSLNSGKQISFEELRQKVNEFQYEVANMAARKMGLPKCENLIFGTTGYDSDIDSSMHPTENVKQKELMLHKLLIDTAWTYVVGDLSGIQGDLEVYMEHPGITLNTEKRASTTQGMQGFTTLEMGLSILELRRSFGTHKNDWEAMVKKLLEKFKSPPEFTQALKQMISDAARLEGHVSTQVLAQAIRETGKAVKDLNPSDIKRAAATYKISRLITLSEKMDAVESKRAELEARRNRLNNSLIGAPNPQIRNKCSDDIKKCSSEIMDLELTLASLAALRNAMFDETYLCQTAYNKTCEARGGQKDKLETQGGAKPSKRAPPTFTQHVFGAIEDFAKYNAKIQKYMRLEEANAKEDEGLSKKERENATHQFMHAVVDGSKYALRITSSCVESAKHMLGKVKAMTYAEKQKLGITVTKLANLNALVNQAIELEKISSDLEKCKRKQILNEVTYLRNMKDANFSEIQAKAIDQAFKGIQRPEDVITKIVANKYPPNVATIIKARAGFDRMLKENESLTKLHIDSEKITLESHQLTTPQSIDAHNKAIQTLTQDVLQTGINLGFVSVPTVRDPASSNPKIFDFLSIWQGLEPQPQAA